MNILIWIFNFSVLNFIFSFVSGLAINRLVEKFKQQGSVRNHTGAGRPPTVCTLATADLTAPHFFLWVYLKERVYINMLQTAKSYATSVGKNLTLWSGKSVRPPRGNFSRLR